MFFVCPKCGKMETLYSSGNFIECKKCGFKAEYTNNLQLVTNDEGINFHKMLDWYNYQIRYVNNLQINGDIIFNDKDVRVFEINPYKKRKLISNGSFKLFKDKLVLENINIDVKNIFVASPIGGRKFAFSTEDKNYLVIGNERFNPLKYILLFNKLDTKMKLNNTDIYFDLNEREE